MVRLWLVRGSRGCVRLQAHHRNRPIFKVKKFLIEVFVASLRLEGAPEIRFFIVVPVPRQKNARTFSHPRGGAQSETRETYTEAVLAMTQNAVVMRKILTPYKMNLLQ